jgi:hypothetical protein
MRVVQMGMPMKMFFSRFGHLAAYGLGSRLLVAGRAARGHAAILLAGAGDAWLHVVALTGSGDAWLQNIPLAGESASCASRRLLGTRAGG